MSEEEQEEDHDESNVAMGYNEPKSDGSQAAPQPGAIMDRQILKSNVSKTEQIDIFGESLDDKSRMTTPTEYDYYPSDEELPERDRLSTSTIPQQQQKLLLSPSEKAGSRQI